MFFDMFVILREAGMPIYGYATSLNSIAEKAGLIATLELNWELRMGESIKFVRMSTKEYYQILRKNYIIYFEMDNEFLNENKDVEHIINTLAERFDRIYGELIDKLICKPGNYSVGEKYFKGFDVVINDFFALRYLEKQRKPDKEDLVAVELRPMFDFVIIDSKSGKTIQYRIINHGNSAVKLLFMQDAYPSDAFNVDTLNLTIKHRGKDTEETFGLSVDDGFINLGSFPLPSQEFCTVSMKIKPSMTKICYIHPKLVVLNSGGIRKEVNSTTRIIKAECTNCIEK